MKIERYSDSRKQQWDNFVRSSKNGTFLFHRDYMDYHRDRFPDSSLVIVDNTQVIALLPATRNNSTLFSHAGLTYGGFITNEAMKLPKMLEAFEATLAYLQANDVKHFFYSTIPFIYHRAPAEEDRYALFLANARLVRRSALAVNDSRCALQIQERRRRGVRKAQQSGLVVEQNQDWPIYWDILTERLARAHHVKPVHSLAEIQSLHATFPHEIKLFVAHKNQAMLAGVVIYESEQVAHVQYIAANDAGQELGALDLIFTHLLNNVYSSKRYFDFGSSDERDSRWLNKGLIDQKEGYGARVVVHDHYEIDVADWTPGQLLGAMQ